MNKLRAREGRFLAPNTLEPKTSLKVVLTDEGELARNFYNRAGELKCWSSNSNTPDGSVPLTDRQSPRCIDCVQNIKGGASYKSKPCKFFTTVTFVEEESKMVCSLRIGGASLFAKAANKMTLYQYRDYLKSNGEKLNTILTEVYFFRANDFYKIYFKPSRPLTPEDMEAVEELIERDEENRNLFNNIGNNSMNKNSYILKNVTARYPRIDQPYKFDSKAGARGKSVPCDALEDGACYELGFIMSKAQAKDLYASMSAVYNEAKDSSWPDKLELPFTQLDGELVGKAKLKASYDKKPTGRPALFDSQNASLAEDFMLTTGSTISVAIELIPYSMATSGVSLRLRGVQVIEYIPYKPASPFDIESGFSAVDAPAAAESVEDMFGNLAEEVDSEEVEAVVEPEPVKRSKKKEEVPKPKEEDSLSSIIDDWGSEDA
tara:strand:+ start:2815 stop:4113 length:1299 start_codon:yes stop_codon:yes gene_type:complete